MQRIVQVELTNICNRQCFYCGNPLMKRKKGFMDDRTMERVIWLLKGLGQTIDVGLHHFGESTLHPRLVEFIRRFNSNGITPFLNTNGDFLTDKLISELATVNLTSLIISGHKPRPERIALYEKCIQGGIKNTFWQVDLTEETGLTTMGGQVPISETSMNAPPLTNPLLQCGFLRKEMSVILWNGDLTACCFDYEGHGVFGNIFDDNVMGLKPSTFSVCDGCPGHPGEP